MAEKNNANIGFEKQIWDAACVLWGHIPAAEYRKVIVGLIFLRYISSAFEKRYQELVAEGDGFEDDRDAYIEDNILFHHNKIPMGEFAIGTNTTAYVVAEKYGIEDKLPILIAEKMGPHFAVGDTCYSWAEDTPVFNPDGREIIARDNEISALRKEDISMAYYGCHTDITIPYEELGSISVIDEDGESLPIIENGRFVLPGTEELNKPFEV